MSNTVGRARVGSVRIVSTWTARRIYLRRWITKHTDALIISLSMWGIAALAVLIFR